MPAPGATPATCQVLRWVVFGPGVWKDERYSPERCRQIVTNFARLSRELGHTVPRAGLGHDRQQRFARSLGFGNVGTVTRCALVPGYESEGYFEIDVTGVPTVVGGQIAGGWLPGGSVELKSHQRDPEDPAEEVPGDVLTGVAFLGEEQPAVRAFPPDLQPRTRPRATFADGSPVPPGDPEPWLRAMADVTRQMAAEYAGEYDPARRTARIKGREFSDRTLCFSDLADPGGTMTPDEIQAKLQAAGKTPEEIAGIMAALAGTTASAGAAPVATATPPVPPVSSTMSATGAVSEGATDDADAKMMAAACKKYADDPAATPDQKMMARMYADMQEQKKRVGELMAAADMDQKKGEEAAMAAFSDRVKQAVAPLYKKVAPVVIEKVHVPTLMGLRKATFSSESDRVKAFNDYLAPLLALPDDARLATGPGAAVTAAPLAADAAQGIAGIGRKGGVLDRLAPAAAARARKMAGATA